MSNTTTGRGRPSVSMGSAWPEVDLPQKLTAVTTQTEAPAIDVHIVQSLEPPGGMGEAGTSAIVPAVGNAIFAASGKRVRKLPVDTTALK